MKKTIGSLLVRLGMDAKDADRSLKNFEKNLKDTGRRMESVGKTMSVAFTAPFVAGMFKAIQAFDEEAQATRRLQVALGGTSKALLDQAAALQKVTVFADDAIINEQAWAAALGHSEQQILSMTGAAADLASGLGVDLHQAMEMLHKTTTGTAGGLGKLIPEIKSMTAEQLKAGEAVALVEERFKGFAEAAALTGAGPLKVLQNSFGDLMEQIGEAFLPIVISIADKIKQLIEWFKNLDPEVKTAIVSWGALVAAIGPMLIMLPKIVSLFSALLSPVGLTTAAIVGLGLAAIYVYKNWQVLADGWEVVWVGIKNIAAEGINAIVKGLIGLHNMASQSLDLPMIDVMPMSKVSAGNSQMNPFPKDDRRHSLWKPAKLQGVGEFMTDIGTDIFSFLGGDSGAKKIADATKLIAGLGSALDNTGNSIEKVKEVAQNTRGNPILDSLSSLPINGIKPKGNSITKDLAAMASFGTTDAGAIDEQIKSIQPDLSFQDRQKESLKEQAELWGTLGSAISGAIGQMGSSMKQGEGFFQSFAKAAIIASLQIVKAKLVETAVSNFSWWVSKFGPAGIALGAVSIAAGSAVIDGIIGAIQAPALAQGGMAYGPTMAMVGDNPNAHIDPEVISPLSKLKGMIGGGGGSSRVEFVLKGRDLHGSVLMAEQDNSRMLNSTLSLIR